MGTCLPALATRGLCNCGMSPTPPTELVNSVAFTPDGRTLAEETLDGLLWLWNVADPSHPTSRGKPATGAGARSTSMAFSPDGRTIATAAADGPGPGLWNVADPNHPRLVAQPATGSGVGSVAFSLDGHTLAGASSDGTVRLWNVADPSNPMSIGQPLNQGQRVTTGDGGGPSVAFSPDGHTLASSSGNINMLWELNADQAAERICSTTGTSLTPEKWQQVLAELPFSQPCQSGG